MQPITLDNIEENKLNTIGKMLGINLSGNKDRIREILELHEKQSDFDEILQFINDSGRNNINSFIHKCKDIMTTYINEHNYFKDIDFDEIDKETNNLKQELGFERVKNPKKDEKIGGVHRVMIDIRHANFTALTEMSNKIDTSWEDYFKSVIPIDKRTERPDNFEMGTVGIETQIPECIYHSKYMRMMVLSKVQDKLQKWWELENLRMAKKFRKLNYDNKIQFGSDEFIIETSNFEESQDIADKMDSITPEYINIKIYQVYRVNEYLEEINSEKRFNNDYIINIYKNREWCYSYDFVNVPSSSLDLPILYNIFDEYFTDYLL